jgi:predicted dehydrogenase
VKTYVQVGLGGRHRMFRQALTGCHFERARLKAVCDSNPGRLAIAKSQAEEEGGVPVAAYEAADFERMLADIKPDCVIVTTPDWTHDDYIVRALEAGCDVLTEKPLTIDAARLQRIIDAQRKTGGAVTVTFNYRFTPPRTQIKDLLDAGTIGEVTGITFDWNLDRRHGADYFRRWHREKKNSGGLEVHKSTHHFDLVNWWLGSVPETVYATGGRRFYKPDTAERMGLSGRAPRCRDCRVNNCGFRLDMNEIENLKRLYLDCEEHDGYFRDRCVFAADIDIEDTYRVQAQYRNGAVLNYTLVAFAAWEGYAITFYGTEGTLTHSYVENSTINGANLAVRRAEQVKTTLSRFGEKPQAIEVWKGKGEHGGGDPLMLDMLFDPASAAEDRWRRLADFRAGGWSILTGIAANRSLIDKMPVTVADLVNGLEVPPDLQPAAGGKPLES